jgi:hypothetical protein
MATRIKMASRIDDISAEWKDRADEIGIYPAVKELARQSTLSSLSYLYQQLSWPLTLA